MVQQKLKLESKEEFMKKRQVRYRGISNAVRKAIARGDIRGEIKLSHVRPHLPTGKASASNEVIEKSLSYLAQRKEIIKGAHGRFFTKDSIPKSEVKAPGDQAIVTGTVLDMKFSDGKVLALVEVSSFEK
jgi:hypothetical protein